MKPTRLFAVAALASFCTLHAQPPLPEAPADQPQQQITDAAPLLAAINSANAELRKPNSQTLDAADLLGTLAGTYHLKLRAASLNQLENGDWSVSAALAVSRALNYNDDSQAAIRNCNQSIASARKAAAETVNAFDKRWKRRSVKINGDRVNGWAQPGCQKRNPPITDQEHSRRRENIIARGHAAIAAGESQLEATKARYKEQRETILRRARTVDVRLSLPADAPQLDLIRSGRDATIQVTVASLTIAQDPPEILRPSRHISALQLNPVPAGSASSSTTTDASPQATDSHDATQSES